MAAVEYEHVKEMTAFVDAKTGVKGLMDAGVVKDTIPKIFVHPSENRQDIHPTANPDQPKIPLIDLKDIQIDQNRRKQAVEEICKASETWGLFQIVNHSVSEEVRNGLLEAICKFHELPKDEKTEIYSNDGQGVVKKPTYEKIWLYGPADWRDSMYCAFHEDLEKGIQTLPPFCRNGIREYMKSMGELKKTLLELLSEALGLNTDFLVKMDETKSMLLFCNYYPACPEPNLTLGCHKHTDYAFLTVLIQNEICGLQCLYENQWFDVNYVPGSFTVNLGDFLQILSNDRFKSAPHRVRANKEGPRLSSACFFLLNPEKPYGPAKELVTDDKPAMYKPITFAEYLSRDQAQTEERINGLAHLRLY